MHKPKFLFPAIALVLMVAAWTARGWLDEITMYAGRFHVINGTDSSALVSLTFPNGEQRNAALVPFGTIDWYLAQTGEGAIQVVFQGKDLGKIGYVTAHNNLSVICLTNGQAIFSQIFPHVANMP
jgi:hypothetical protein